MDNGLTSPAKNPFNRKSILGSANAGNYKYDNEGAIGVEQQPISKKDDSLFSPNLEIKDYSHL